MRLNEVRYLNTSLEEYVDCHTERLWWQVVTELCADNARVAVCACDLAPDDSKFATSDLLLCAINVCDLLA
jgi:hypothetical protein